MAAELFWPRFPPVGRRRRLSAITRPPRVDGGIARGRHCRKFMPDTIDWHRRLRTAFEDALAQDPAARDAFVVQHCADDPELRRHVLRLLEAHLEAGEFLEQPASDVAGFLDDASASVVDDAPLAAGDL